jgi:hypothetical protein
MKMNDYIHPHVCFYVYWYNIHFVIKFLGFICMCIGENAFYHPKFQF